MGLVAVAFIALLLLAPPSQARRFGYSRYRKYDSYAFARGGVGIGMLRFGRQPESSMPVFSYSYGAGALFLFAHDLELEVGAQMLWNGGRAESTYPYGQGRETRVNLQLRYSSLNVPVLCNYHYQISEDVSLYGGAGVALSSAFWGRVCLDQGEAGEVVREVRLGFDDKDHIQPLDAGAVGQLGVRWQHILQVVVWFEYDFINHNVVADAPLPDLNPVRTMHYDMTAPLLHYFGETRSMTAGISAMFLLPIRTK